MTVYKAGDDWIFSDGATVVDAHLVPFIIRRMDCNRDDLVPEALQEYAKKHATSDQWDHVMRGRPTMWNVSLGHVSDMAAEYDGPL